MCVYVWVWRVCVYARVPSVRVCIRVYVFAANGACNYYGFARQVSRVTCVGYMSCLTFDNYSHIDGIELIPVFLVPEFIGGGKPCYKRNETAALRRGIQQASHT